MADDVMFRDATGREVTYGRAMFSYVLVIVTIFGGIIFTIIGINNGNKLWIAFGVIFTVVTFLVFIWMVIDFNARAQKYRSEQEDNDIDNERGDQRRHRRYHRSQDLQQQTRHFRLPVVTTRTGTSTSRTRSRTPSATPSRTPSPVRGQRFRLPVVTNRSGTPTNRVRPRSPSRTPQRTPSATPSRTPSPDRQEYLQNPPSYEGVSQRPEENPSDTGVPPPSYEEVMTGSFTQIQIEGSDECANQRQEQSPDSHRSV